MRSLLKSVLGVACALGLSVSSAHADKLADILSKGVVRIGVPLDAPPFGAQDANRNPVGFDIELAEMVGKALGVKVEMQQITGANRIPYLLTDKVDIVISVMGLTPERAKQIMFTSPYANTFLAVYGSKSLKVTSADEIGHKQGRRGQGHDSRPCDLRDEPARDYHAH